MIPSSLILRTVEIPIIQRKYSILADISIRFSYSNLLFSGKCCTVEFNSTYPVQLEGIIEQTEFEESIQNINQAISQRDSFIMVDLLPEICLLIGIILMLAGGVVFMFFILPIIPVLIAVACSTFVFGMIFVVFGCCLIQADLSDQMQQAIARESTKYSTRTPTPCSWRLNLRRIHAGNLDNYGVSDILPIYRFDTILKNIFLSQFQIIVEIGRNPIPQPRNRSLPSNRRTRQQVSSSLQPDNTPPPPPYDSHKAIKFCSQCGMPKQNPTSRFCASCGRSLNV